MDQATGWVDTKGGRGFRQLLVGTWRQSGGCCAASERYLVRAAYGNADNKMFWGGQVQCGRMAGPGKGCKEGVPVGVKTGGNLRIGVW